LHGKTYDYKIKYTSIVRLFQLPKPDRQHMFFVISLEPPIRQGHTSYPHLVLQFREEEKIDLEPNIPNDDDDKRFTHLKALGKLSGPRYQIVTKIFKILTNNKITMPKSFRSESGHSCFKCSLRANEGYLYPLERSFFYVHKPPTHIRFEEIANIEFARVRMDSEVNRTFDIDINLKSGVTTSFTSINRKEYSPLFNFIMHQGLKILNVETGDVLQPTQVSVVEPGDDEEEKETKWEMRKGRKEARMRVRQAMQAEELPENDSEEEDNDFKPAEGPEGDDHDISESESDLDDDELMGKKKDKDKKKDKKEDKEKKEKRKRESDDEQDDSPAPLKRSKEDTENKSNKQAGGKTETTTTVTNSNEKGGDEISDEDISE